MSVKFLLSELRLQDISVTFSRLWQLSLLECPPGHPLSAAVLRDQIKGTLVALSLQLLQNHAVRMLEELEV
jgi:hypothetical protein